MANGSGALFLNRTNSQLVAPAEYMQKLTPPGTMVEPVKRNNPRLILNCLNVSVGRISNCIITPLYCIRAYSLIASSIEGANSMVSVRPVKSNISDILSMRETKIALIFNNLALLAMFDSRYKP